MGKRNFGFVDLSKEAPQRNRYGHIHYDGAKPPKPWSPEVYAAREHRRLMHIRYALIALAVLGIIAVWALGGHHG